MVLALSADPDFQENDDYRLMQRVAARDRAAQRQVAERLGGRVLRLCRTLLEDQAEAEDAAQQSLVQVLLSARSYQASGRLEGWADKITVRTAMKHARGLRAGRSFIMQVALPERIACLAQDLRYRNTTPRQMETYLNRLTPEKREAFVLKHALDYTIEEIASLTESPPGTVKDRLVRAKKQLRKMIDRNVRNSRRGSS